MSTNLK